MITKLRTFGLFWYDFLIGDDWRVALGVVIALALTFALTQAGLPAWWVLPAALVLLLTLSLHQATRRH